MNHSSRAKFSLKLQTLGSHVNLRGTSWRQLGLVHRLQWPQKYSTDKFMIIRQMSGPLVASFMSYWPASLLSSVPARQTSLLTSIEVSTTSQRRLSFLSVDYLSSMRACSTVTMIDLIYKSWPITPTFAKLKMMTSNRRRIFSCPFRQKAEFSNLSQLWRAPNSCFSPISMTQLTLQILALYMQTSLVRKIDRGGFANTQTIASSWMSTAARGLTRCASNG